MEALIIIGILIFILFAVAAILDFITYLESPAKPKDNNNLTTIENNKEITEISNRKTVAVKEEVIPEKKLTNEVTNDLKLNNIDSISLNNRIPDLIVKATNVFLATTELNIPESIHTIENKSEKQIPNKISKDNLNTDIQNNLSKNVIEESSIIDITPVQFTNIEIVNSLKEYKPGVPHWEHHYVYSYSEIERATVEQKEFYFKFRNSFLNEVYFDLNGNTNYAFILLFDLLNDYEKHYDIARVEKHIKSLGNLYPKTKSYGLSFLIKKIEILGESSEAIRLRYEKMESENYNIGGYWRLGDRYKTKLNLKNYEVNTFNRLWHPTNSFTEIEFCLFEVLKLFRSVISGLNSKFENEKDSLENQLMMITDSLYNKEILQRNYNVYPERTTSELYIIIFKYCENAVRELYGIKRKLNTDFFYLTGEIKTEFDKKIISIVLAFLPILIVDVSPPDEATEKKLNYQNTNRWKIKFKELTCIYKNNPKEFVDSVILLGSLNWMNPSKKNIFFEASVFIANFNKEAALILYIHYLHCDINSTKFENKVLSKTVQKTLFSTDEQLINFQIIVNEFINDKNFEKALNSISNIYVSNRRKIELDIKKIQEAQAQHSETVGLLNEYLNDELIDEKKSIEKDDIKHQVQDYESILAELKNAKLEKEIKDELNNKVKRKKIELDDKTIEELKLQQSETIVLLNEYLKDDNDENTPIKTFKTETEIVNSVKKTNNNTHSAYLVEFRFSENQIFGLDMFKENNFSVSQSKFETFAKSKGVFSHQLIESINEICYDYLDDVLIEEEGENYIINPNYYQKISAK